MPAIMRDLEQLRRSRTSIRTLRSHIGGHGLGRMQKRGEGPAVQQRQGLQAPAKTPAAAATLV
jgi:hypothetical protein